MFENTLTQESHSGPGFEEVSHLMFGSYLASSTCTLLSPPADACRFSEAARDSESDGTLVPIFVLGTFRLFVLTYIEDQPSRPSLDDTSLQQLGCSSGNLFGACVSYYGTVP